MSDLYSSSFWYFLLAAGYSGIGLVLALTFYPLYKAKQDSEILLGEWSKYLENLVWLTSPFGVCSKHTSNLDVAKILKLILNTSSTLPPNILIQEFWEFTPRVRNLSDLKARETGIASSIENAYFLSQVEKALKKVILDDFFKSQTQESVIFSKSLVEYDIEASIDQERPILIPVYSNLRVDNGFIIVWFAWPGVVIGSMLKILSMFVTKWPVPFIAKTFPRAAAAVIPKDYQK